MDIAVCISHSHYIMCLSHHKVNLLAVVSGVTESAVTSHAHNTSYYNAIICNTITADTKTTMRYWKEAIILQVRAALLHFLASL